MKKKQGVATNRTGVATSPELAQELIDAARRTPPSSDGDAEAVAAVRIAYSSVAERVGTVPPAPARKGAAKGMPALVDKLGERLAFERSGVRLYQALISKFDAFGTWKGGPSREDLELIRDEEHQHFLMLVDIITEMGGDPTAVTPAADFHAVASMGLPAVLADPRTDLKQCLDAVLIAELVDNDGWATLTNLALALEEQELAQQCKRALEQERLHLYRVRTWCNGALGERTGATIPSALMPPQNGSDNGAEGKLKRAKSATKLAAAPRR
jgi:ferritin-like protein